MTWVFALMWWLLGVMAGCGFMMWVQSARKYHEERTDEYLEQWRKHDDRF